jgi:hypothetical protein
MGTIEYKDDTPNGPFKFYYKSGKIKREGTFKEGQFEGENVKYYENGSVEYSGEYNNGKEEGLFMFFDEDGWLTDSTYYLSGKQHGEHYSFFSSGELEYFRNYQNGLMEGEFKQFDKNDTLRFEAWMVNDTARTIVKYDTLGRAIEDFYNWTFVDFVIEKGRSYAPKIWFSDNQEFFIQGEKKEIQIDVPGMPKEALRYTTTNSTIRPLPEFRKFEVVAKNAGAPVKLTVFLITDTAIELGSREFQVKPNVP